MRIKTYRKEFSCTKAEWIYFLLKRKTARIIQIFKFDWINKILYKLKIKKEPGFIEMSYIGMDIPASAALFLTAQRVFARTVAQDLVSVQPMSAPGSSLTEIKSKRTLLIEKYPTPSYIDKDGQEVWLNRYGDRKYCHKYAEDAFALPSGQLFYMDFLYNPVIAPCFITLDNAINPSFSSSNLPEKQLLIEKVKK